MTDVYENCPVFENDSYILRMTSQEDKSDLLKVYSDKAAVSFFNSDNCGGDDFYYTTESRMEQAIAYWLFEYNRAGFVRWTIVSKETNEAIGTIELFHRDGLFYGLRTAQIGYPERLRKSRRNYKNIENDHRTRVYTLSLR